MFFNMVVKQHSKTYQNHLIVIFTSEYKDIIIDTFYISYRKGKADSFPSLDISFDERRKPIN